MRWMRHWWRSIRSRISPWSGSGSCRSIRSRKCWRWPSRLLEIVFFLRRTGADQGLQFPGEAGTIGVRQIQELERLQAALGGPHREQHFGRAADGGDAEVEQHGHPDTFVERIFE